MNALQSSVRLYALQVLVELIAEFCALAVFCEDETVVKSLQVPINELIFIMLHEEAQENDLVLSGGISFPGHQRGKHVHIAVEAEEFGIRQNFHDEIGVKSAGVDSYNLAVKV